MHSITFNHLMHFNLIYYVLLLTKSAKRSCWFTRWKAYILDLCCNMCLCQSYIIQIASLTFMERYHKLTTTPLVIFQLQEIWSRFWKAKQGGERQSFESLTKRIHWEPRTWTPCWCYQRFGFGNPESNQLAMHTSFKWNWYIQVHYHLVLARQTKAMEEGLCINTSIRFACGQVSQPLCLCLNTKSSSYPRSSHFQAHYS